MTTTFFWFALLVTITYGVTTSPLLAVARIRLALVHPLLEAFIYCPVCVGFWTALVLEFFVGAFAAFPVPPLAAGVIGATLLHLLAVLPGFLPSAHATEEPIIEDLREMRKRLEKP